MPGQTYGRAVEVSAAWLDRGATAGVRGLNKELGGTGTAAQAAERGVDSFGRRIVSADTLVRDFTRSLATFATGYISVRGVMELGSIATEMYQTRTQVGALSQALEFQLAPAGKTVAQAMREARAQTAGVISDLTLMVQMRSAMEALTGAGFNPVEAYDIFQTSSRFAVLQGKVFGKGDPNQILERLMTGFSRGAFQWLDDYNLRVQGLTGTFDIVNEAMRQMNKGLEEQGRLIEQSVTGLDRMRTGWANVKAGTSDAISEWSDEKILAVLGALDRQRGGFWDRMLNPSPAGVYDAKAQRRIREEADLRFTQGPSYAEYQRWIEGEGPRLMGESRSARDQQMLEDAFAAALERAAAPGRPSTSWASEEDMLAYELDRLGIVPLDTSLPEAAYPSRGAPLMDSRRRGLSRFLGSWSSADESYRGENVHYMGFGESFGYGFNQWVPQGGLSQMFGQQLGQTAFGTLVGGPMAVLANALTNPIQEALGELPGIGVLFGGAGRDQMEAARMQLLAANNMQRQANRYSVGEAYSMLMGDSRGAAISRFRGSSVAYSNDLSWGLGGDTANIPPDLLEKQREIYTLARQGDIAGALALMEEYTSGPKGMRGLFTEGQLSSDALGDYLNALLGLEQAINENTDALRERLEFDAASAGLRAEYSLRFAGAMSEEEIYQISQRLQDDWGYLRGGQSGSYGGGSPGSSSSGAGSDPGYEDYASPTRPIAPKLTLRIEVVSPDGSVVAREVANAVSRGDLQVTLATDGRKVNVRAL